MVIDIYVLRVSKNGYGSALHYVLETSYNGTPEDIFNKYKHFLANVDIDNTNNASDFSLDDIIRYTLKGKSRWAITLDGQKKEILQIESIVKNNSKELDKYKNF